MPTPQYTKIADVESGYHYQPTPEELHAANMCFRCIRLLGVMLAVALIGCMFVILLCTPDVFVNLILKFAVNKWNFWAGFGWGILITMITIPAVCLVVWCGYSIYSAIMVYYKRPDLVDWDYSPTDYKK